MIREEILYQIGEILYMEIDDKVDISYIDENNFELTIILADGKRVRALMSVSDEKEG